MKKIELYLMLIFSSIYVLGCGQSVERAVQQAVVDNQKATSLLDWERSEANPELLFTKWREDYSRDSFNRTHLQKEICTELMNLEDQFLTLFENEIRQDSSQELLGTCKVQLLLKLEAYFAKERETLKEKMSSLTQGGARKDVFFPSNVQKRDTSNGYYAVTGDVSRKEVILTFDDGPSSPYTSSILQALREVNAKAIFFMLGRNVLANPDMVKKVAAEGHAIGSHSKTHACLGDSRACKKTNGHVLSFAEAVNEIKNGHQAIHDVLGWVDPFFRFPYGESSGELSNFLKEKSTAEFHWSIDSEDWRAQANETLLRNTLDRLESKGRGILLFHDIQRRTAEIMPDLLRALYHRGYSIVLIQPLDESARYNSKLVKKNLP